MSVAEVQPLRAAMPIPLPVNYEGIPDTLKAISQWVLWRYIWDSKSSKWGKVPFQPNGTPASSTGPATWCSWAEAIDAYLSEGFAGVGFVVSRDDSVVAVDFDDCVQGDQPHPDLYRYLEILETYTERSPSGTGYHSLLIGKKPGAHCKAKWPTPNIKEIEIYEHGRYLTITGHTVDSLPPDLQQRQEGLETLYRELWPERSSSALPIPTGGGGGALGDGALLQRIYASTRAIQFADLYERGDTDGYGGDDSAADLALCNELAFWTAGNAEQMDRLFRGGALYRPKWDEMRGAQSYGALTIQKALAGCGDLYTPSVVKAPEGSAFAPKLFPRDLMTQPVQPRPRLYGDYLMRRAVACCGGTGGVGKSVFMLAMAVAMATGRDLLGLSRGYQFKQRKVVLLNNEDSYEELELRLRGIIRQFALTGEEQDRLAQNMHYQSGIHTRLKLCIKNPAGEIGPHQTMEDLDRFCVEHGIDVFMADPLVSLHTAVENSNDEMEQVMGLLRSLVTRRDMAGLLLHHTKKGADLGDVDAAFRGATSIPNACRSVLLLTRMSPQEERKFLIAEGTRPSYFRLDEGKQNYAPPSDSATWFKLHSVGFLSQYEDGQPDTEYVGVPAPVDLEPRPQEDARTITARDVVELLDSEEWPIRLPDHYGKLTAFMEVNEQGVRRKMDCFPLVNDGDRSRKEAIFLGTHGYRVWREKASRNAGISLHREAIE